MNKKVKIFLFNPYPSIGGVDNTINEFILSLKDEFDLEYISLNQKDILKKKNIQNTIIKSRSTFWSFFKIYKIFKDDKHEKKIFFSFQYFANIWSIIFIKLILKGKLLIYEVNHLDEFKYFSNISEIIKKRIIKLAVEILYKYPDIVATNSIEATSDLSKFIKRKVYTLPNPCFKKIHKKKRMYKSRKKINILNISRFEKQKNHITLLKAILHSGIKDQIHLVLVGYGSKQSEIKEFIKRNNINAKILFKKNELRKFYLKADLYICTSLYEGLPTTVIEAASYCIPIISSDFKSGAKEILRNGKAGTIFKKADYKKLSKILCNFFVNPKPYLKKEYECRKYLKNYSVRNSTLILKRVLKKF